ncbi:Fatty acid oxidation complex subunit alpha [Rhodobacteraceae bacterium THAF1]|uniref:3-hydroxyacyl-CoA dehydrogenase NAD-binding domain-containing protein n=1 Tax=Palleronia sp. THAF1 TaxID=2587842 RepID=UPI000F3C0E69|nr:3-hydroxyacyl-CoA dehydrogenase NAD-binding domain-containing protein [Palleronia sp. THAF1]QFU08012.1 Fatty acid oxidation complex subunit alpha [Palleronia sp. THAF1]VDC27865.1 Fatty acid oxidation complex subunit alpha [Rhodobacteraceae bacterium THAF1]
MTNPVRYETEGQIAVITVNNPPVNALGHAVRQGLMDAANRFAGDDAAQIAVIVGAGRLFLGGADISEFGKTPQDPILPDVIDRIEALEKPVVAAIHGAALGGGLEVALGCHYRVALKGAKIGLPEVGLGILPGAGGTQRTPRLTGVEDALDLIVSGKPVDATRAQVIGLVDRMVEGDDARIAGLAYAGELLEMGATARPVSDMDVPSSELDWEARDADLERKFPGQVAQRHAAKAVRAATQLPFAEGRKEERRLFMELMETPQRDGLIHAFFLERKVSNLPELQGVEPRPIKAIGVIGGGTMGSGIATAALLAGLPVTLVETSVEAASKADATIAKNLDGAVKRGKMTEAKRAAADLTTTTDYEALSEADVVIEAVFESMDVKHQVFDQLDRVMKDGAVLATNTSYLDVTKIAGATKRPQDVIGLHFFSPAHVMKLLEVVVPERTAPEVTATAFRLAKTLGKTAVRSGVCDGFIGNRMLSHYRSAADEMILQGASPYQIDAALERFGFAMGPSKVADLAGLDIGSMTRDRKGRDLPGIVNPDWADALVENGDKGRKTGKGFYVYGDDMAENPDVQAHIDAAREKAGITARDFTDTEIVERYMAAMINEGARIVDEGIAQRPLDVDAVKLFGYGFPRYRGGPMKYADQVGLSTIRDRITRYAKDNPTFWSVAPMLDTLADRDGKFEELNQ